MINLPTILPDAVMAAVETVMSLRWKWGERDCCASACTVFFLLHGIDPMKPVRGKYSDAISAYRLIRDWGGFPAMAESLAQGAKLQIGQGKPGEIGLSGPGMAGGPDGRALLICIQPGQWAGKSEMGYTILPGAERCWRA